MRVAFVHHETIYRGNELRLQRALAARMLASVRKHIGCPIVQLTDLQTAQIASADEVMRLDPRGKCFIPWALELIGCLRGPFLLLDTDTIVQRDVSNVFEDEFAVAVTVKRKRFAQYVDRDNVTHYMPFSMGVVFSRSPWFWYEVRKRVLAMRDENMLGWWGAQIALYEMYQEGKWNMKLLESEEYNYTPRDEHESVSTRAIVHYKGAHRKHWGMSGFDPLPQDRPVAVMAA